MRKFPFIVSLLLVVYGSVSGQVGIQTINPQGVFDVDATGDNATSGTPTTAQLSNDFIVTSTGQVGVMTIPSTGVMLEVNGQIKLTGGSPGTGRILVTDTNGLATWQKFWTGVVYGMTATSIGSLSGASFFSTTNTGVTASSITVPSAGLYRITSSYYTCYSSGAGVANFALSINGVANGFLFDNSPTAAENCLISTHTRYIVLNQNDVLTWARSGGIGSTVTNGSVEVTLIAG